MFLGTRARTVPPVKPALILPLPVQRHGPTMSPDKRFHPRGSLPPVDSQTTGPAARCVPISIAGSLAPARLRTAHNCAPVGTRISARGTPGKLQNSSSLSPGRPTAHRKHRSSPAGCGETVPDTRRKRGSRLAVVSSDSQIRQSLGKITLADAPDTLPAAATTRAPRCALP
jgi:hypothetical protein